MYIVALANHNNEIILLTVLLNYSYSSCIDIHPNDIAMHSWPSYSLLSIEGGI